MPLRSASRLATAISAVLVCALSPIGMTQAHADATVRDHGPVGTMRDVLQVRMRFGADIAALGDRQAAPAAEVQCDNGVRASGRWLDTRQWVAKFGGALADGVRCRVTPSTTLRTVDQSPVKMPPPWTFDTGGPRLKNWLAANAQDGGYGPSELVKEMPLLALAASTRVAADSLRDLRCEVNGIQQAVRVLQGDAHRQAVLALLPTADDPAQNKDREKLDELGRRLDVPAREVIIARCGDTLQWPQNATVRWVWGRGIATPSGLTNPEDRVLTLRVRPPFTARLRCPQLAGTVGCDPRRDLTLEFSAPVGTHVLQAARLHDGHAPHAPVNELYPKQRTLRSLRFAGPFAEGASMRLQLPERLQDADGRPLGNPGRANRSESTESTDSTSNTRDAGNVSEVTTPIRIARLPAYLGMAAPQGLLPWLQAMAPTQTQAQPAPAQWAVALRNTGPNVTVKRWQLDSRASNAALIGLHRHAASDEGRDEPGIHGGASSSVPLARAPGSASNTSSGTPSSTASATALSEPWATPFTTSTRLLRRLQIEARSEVLPLAPDGDAMRFAPVSLPGPGTWLIEADSPAYRETVARQYAAGPLRREAAHELAHQPTHDQGPDPRPVNDTPDRRAAQDAGEREQFRRALARSYEASRLAVVQVSDLNLHARLTPQGQSLVWVTSLHTGEPLNNVAIDLVDCEARVLTQGRSDAHGRLLLTLPSAGITNCSPGRISPQRASRVFPIATLGVWVIARHGADVAVLDARQQAIPDTQPIVHAVLDRPLFAAGETVSMALLARQADASGWRVPAPFASTLKIYRDYREAISEQPLRWDAAGQAHAAWPIPADARLGRYRYEILDSAGQALGSGEFSVEEFRTPAFEARLAGTAAPFAASPVLRIEGRLAFLAGGAAAGETVRLAHAVTGVTHLPDFPGYHFGQSTLKLDSPQHTPAPQSIKLDASGALVTHAPMPSWDRPLAVRSEMAFADANGETQTVSAHTHLLPDRENIGLHFERKGIDGMPVDASTPDGRPRSGTGRLSLVVLDDAARPLAGREIRLTVQAATIDYRAQRIVPGAEQAVQLCTVRSEVNGQAECVLDLESLRIAPQAELLIRAMTNNQVRTAMLLPRWHFQQRGTDSKPVLQRVRASGPMPGEEDEWLLRPPFLPATVLLTVEREQVMHSEVFRINTPEHHVRLPIRADFVPGVQVRAVVVPGVGTDETHAASANRSGGAPANREPVRSINAEASLLLHPDSRRLQVEVQPATTVSEPGKAVKARIQVSDARTGQPMPASHVTVAVVDDALLQLMPNPSWQVLPAFWQLRRPLVTGTTLDQQLRAPFSAGVQTGFLPEIEALISEDAMAPQARMMAMSAPPPAPSPASARAKSAAVESTTADAANPVDAPRSRFSTLALWQAELTTGADGASVIEVPLPDTLTRWRVVAIATAGTDRFGTGEATLVTRKTLQIIPGLPQLLRSDDRVVQRVTLRNTGNAPLEVRLSAEARLQQANGLTSDPRLNDAVAPPPEVATARGLRIERRLRLNAGENHTEFWPVAVPDGISALHWDIAAHGVIAAVPGNTPARERQEPPKAPEAAHALEATSSAVSDRLLLVQQIAPAIPITVRASTLLQLDQPQTLQVSQPDGARPDLGGIRVNFEAKLTEAALGGVRDWMQAYPYTCLEQLASRAVVSGNAQQWQELARTFPDYLDDNGLPRYFKGTNLPGSATLGAYLLDLANGAGLPLDETLRTRLLQGIGGALDRGAATSDWLPGSVEANSAGPASVARTAYRLALQATLAEAGIQRPTLAMVNVLDPGALPSVALIDWVRYLQTVVHTQERTQRLEQATQQLRARYAISGTRMHWRHGADQDYWWMMWNRDVAAARMALLAQRWAQTDARWRDEAPRIARGLIDLQQNGRWSTTVANAWGVIALRDFARTHEATSVQGRVSAWLDDARTGREAGAVHESPGTVAQRSAWPAAPALHFGWPHQGARSTLALRHEGSGAPWATVEVRAAVPANAAIANGLKISREVLPVQRKVPGKWSVGDVYQVTLRMAADSDMGWVVVRDPVPSGASILGKGFERESQLAQQQGPRQAWWQPTLVERANDSYRGYYARVWRGHWETSYRVRLNNAGAFSLPPTRIEAMYAPEIFGEAPNASIDIRP